MRANGVQLVPIQQFGTEAQLGWVVTIAKLPSQTTSQNYGPDKLEGIVNRQHPDHDQRVDFISTQPNAN